MAAIQTVDSKLRSHEYEGWDSNTAPGLLRLVMEAAQPDDLPGLVAPDDDWKLRALQTFTDMATVGGGLPEPQASNMINEILQSDERDDLPSGFSHETSAVPRRVRRRGADTHL